MSLGFSPGGAAVHSRGRQPLDRDAMTQPESPGGAVVTAAPPGLNPMVRGNSPRGWRPWLWTAAPPGLRTLRGVGLAFFLLLSSACQQQMAKQPRFRPLQPTSFFDDGRSARPLVPGTVARGQLRADTHLYTGKQKNAASVEAIMAAFGGDLGGILAAALAGDEYVDTFPFPITEKVLERGQERFNIFCAVCHDRVGTGQGMIVLRGFTRPPSFHTDLSRGYKLRGVEVKLPAVRVG